MHAQRLHDLYEAGLIALGLGWIGAAILFGDGKLILLGLGGPLGAAIFELSSPLGRAAEA